MKAVFAASLSRQSSSLRPSERATTIEIESDFMKASVTPDGLERGLACSLELAREPSFHPLNYGVDFGRLVEQFACNPEPGHDPLDPVSALHRKGQYHACLGAFQWCRRREAINAPSGCDLDHA